MKFKKGQIPWNKGKKGLQVAWNKGIPQTDIAKKKNSDFHLNNPNNGEFKNGHVGYISTPWLGCFGELSPNWKGGKKVWIRKRSTKRRKLGNDLINTSLFDDEVAHHLTKEFIAYVPEYINKSCYHNIHTGKNMDEVNFYTLNYLFLVCGK